MTVTSSTAKSGPYTANGVTTTFSRTFRILQASHLRVVQAIDGIAADLISGFTHTGIGENSGTVVFTTPPPTGATITLVRNVPQEQQSDYSSQASVDPTVIENDLDLMVMRIQDLQTTFAGDFDTALARFLSDLPTTSYANLIQNGAITTQKLANDAVNTDKLANSAVTEPKLAALLKWHFAASRRPIDRDNFIEFAGIPAGVNEVFVRARGIRVPGNFLIVQFGTSDGMAQTGYVGSAGAYSGERITGGALSNGFLARTSHTADRVSFSQRFLRIDPTDHLWAAMGTHGQSNSDTDNGSMQGEIALDAPPDTGPCARAPP